VDISDEIERLSQKSQQLTRDIYANLTPWQVTQIARHPQRPYTLDYVNEVFTDFQELHGDRHYADDLSIVGGLARFNGQACMVLGHQKGRDTKERTQRNFGMSRPEGYRKALRLMKLAEKFGLPVFTFVDTPGAYPGIGAEERGQSEAIGPQHLRDGAARSAHRQHHHRRRRLRRRAGHQRGRPGADAAVQRLLGDFARRLRVHPVEDGRTGGRGRRNRWASPRIA
jgi:acetyl-CoA carboxylase carboxyl transferase alpha subunit